MNPFRVVAAAALSMLLNCGLADATVEEERDKDVTTSDERLTVASAEMYPAPHASLSLSGLSPSSPKTATFSYHPNGATMASDRYRLVQLPSLPLNRPL